MSELLIMAFDTEDAAFDLRERLEALHGERHVDAGDVAVVTRDPEGTVRLHQKTSLSAAQALGGGIWGAIIGAVFLNPFAGAAIGAGIGAVTGALSDIGINDSFMREAAEMLPRGGSALFVLLQRDGAEEVLHRLRESGATGQVLVSPLPGDLRARLERVMRGGGTLALAGGDFVTARQLGIGPIVGRS